MVEEVEIKRIQGYEDYWLDTSGNVYTEKSKKFLKPSKDGSGYFKVILYKNGKRKICRIHRLVAQTFLPDFDENLFVDHINRVRDDNRIENLRMVTCSQNLLNCAKNHECKKGYCKHRNGFVVQYYEDARRKTAYFQTEEEASNFYELTQLFFEEEHAKFRARVDAEKCSF